MLTKNIKIVLELNKKSEYFLGARKNGVGIKVKAISLFFTTENTSPLFPIAHTHTYIHSAVAWREKIKKKKKEREREREREREKETESIKQQK